MRMTSSSLRLARLPAAVLVAAVMATLGPAPAPAPASASASAPASASASASDAIALPHRPGRKLRIGVLVITMFDDETAPWLAHEALPVEVPVPGAHAPLHCDVRGMCVAQIGIGKSNAATSMMAILDSPRLDLRHTYFLTAGIAGTSPESGTLGFAAWARWVVDWDLGRHLLPYTAPEVPHGYLPGRDVGTNVFRLNEALVQKAYRLTRQLKLTDSAEAVAARAHYPGQAGQHPYVAACDTITGDDYWVGRELSESAEYITDLRTNKRGRYCTSQQEDNATATALARHGYLDRYLVLRAAANFDQPWPGQTITEHLALPSPARRPAVDNAYLVASTVAHHMLTRAPDPAR